MPIKYAYQPYLLDFKFEAGTSRGVLKNKQTYFIKIWNEDDPETFGLGECGPLKGLSIDDRSDFQIELDRILNNLGDVELPGSDDDIYRIALNMAGADFPSVRFGLETAMLDLFHGGNRTIYHNAFIKKNRGIAINGLVWMGPVDAIISQVNEKIKQGFDCIKIKIGALDFHKECDVLKYIRDNFIHQELLLRVDANGAFIPHESLEKLGELSKYDIHSIEQPIMSGQWELMQELCRKSPIAIALDEELIGVNEYDKKLEMLQKIKPRYIILKPTLLGGFQSCLEWIKIADGLGIGWWLTSALESNIGLNAISQFAMEVKAKGHQGLGTGKLYRNNIDSPLTIEKGHIFYDENKSWNFVNLDL